MEIEDYEERESFTPQEVEHILGLPLIDIIELLSKVPRAPLGRFQGEACRELIKRLGRGRLFADLIARQSVNAEPEIKRGPESTTPGLFHLVNLANGEEFTVRFSGDLRNYLDRQHPAVELSDENPSD